MARGERTRGPLSYREYRHAFVARIISVGASWMQTVAAGWLIYHLTNSAAAVGVLTVLSRGPGLIFSVAGGQLADRYDPRRLAMALSLAQIVPPAVMAVVAVLGADSQFVIYAAVLAGGILAALSNAPTTWVTSHTVPHELLSKGIGDASVAYSIARLVGPLIGGGLVSTVGIAPCFAANAASYVVMFWALWTIRTPRRERQAARVPLRMTARQAMGHPVLAIVIAGVATFATLVSPIEQLAPAIARRHGEGAHVLGFLLAALALGGLLGNFARSELARRKVTLDRLIGGSLIASAVGMLLLAISPNIIAALLAMICCGLFLEVLYVETLSAMQLVLPELSGALTGLFYTLTAGGITIGAILMGELMDLVGVSLGLALAAAGTGLFGAWRLTHRSRAPIPTM